MNLPIPSCALAIGAHPDDVEFGCGATLAKWASSGCIVHHLILTDGSKGSWDQTADIEELVRTRELEQKEAARVLGASGQVVMLGMVDGELQATPEVRDQVAIWIRRLRPDVVLGHDPWKRYRIHPDHRHAGWLTVDAVVVARDPHFLANSDLTHHRPSTLLLFEADEPDHFEDVTGFGEIKVAALVSHRSQLESTMAISTDDDGTELERFRLKVLDDLHHYGAASGTRAAEAFKLLDVT